MGRLVFAMLFGLFVELAEKKAQKEAEELSQWNEQQSAEQKEKVSILYVSCALRTQF